MNSTILEPLIRTISVFAIVLIIARLLGRKQLSQLTFFDYIAGTAIGALAASAMSNTAIPLLAYVICFITWSLLVAGAHLAALHSVPARKLLLDRPRMVIHDGKILEKSLRGYSVNELLMQLRENGVFDPSEIEVGIIETSGKLSLLKKAEFQPVKGQDLSIVSPGFPASKFAAKELIIDGQIINDNLSAMGLSSDWLKQQVQRQSGSDIKDIVLAILAPDGTLYIDKHSDER